MNPDEIAWAAGLFEGEGTIHVRAKSAIELSMSMTDLDVLEKFCATVGVGAIHPKRRAAALSHHKPQWTWSCSRTHYSMSLLKLMLPWLGERRTLRAKAVIARAEEARWRTCYCGRSFYTASNQSATCSRRCAQALVDARRRPLKAHA